MPTRLHQLVRSSDHSVITKALYLASIDEWIAFAGPNPSGWTRIRAQEFYDSLTARMKPQSANRVFCGVVYASQWYSKMEGRPELDFSVVQKLKKTDSEKTKALSWEDASLLLNTTEGKDPTNMRDRALMVLGLETGMRVMSLKDARYDQMQEDRGYPAINVKIKGSRDKRRAVPLSDTALVALAPWRTWMRNKGANKGHLFQTLTKRIQGVRAVHLLSNTQPPLTTPAIYQIVRRRGESVGLTIHPHMFRASFVTWRLADGWDQFKIATMTWHTMVEVGGLEPYIDRATFGGEIRNSTPPWLSSLVQRLCA
jgi:site-specific recombinase XerD